MKYRHAATCPTILQQTGLKLGPTYGWWKMTNESLQFSLKFLRKN